MSVSFTFHNDATQREIVVDIASIIYATHGASIKNADELDELL